MQIEENLFSVVSFNILSPCYYKLEGNGKNIQLHKGNFSSHQKESDLLDLYQQRYQKIVQIIKELDCDILFLQEYWFLKKNGTDDFLRNNLSKYNFTVLQRTNNKFAIFFFQS